MGQDDSHATRTALDAGSIVHWRMAAHARPTQEAIVVHGRTAFCSPPQASAWLRCAGRTLQGHSSFSS